MRRIHAPSAGRDGRTRRARSDPNHSARSATLARDSRQGRSPPVRIIAAKRFGEIARSPGPTKFRAWRHSEGPDTALTALRAL